MLYSVADQACLITEAMKPVQGLRDGFVQGVVGCALWSKCTTRNAPDRPPKRFGPPAMFGQYRP
jgi:hypothetical protein